MFSEDHIMHDHWQTGKWSANYLSICKVLVSLSFHVFLLYFTCCGLVWLQTVVVKFKDNKN